MLKLRPEQMELFRLSTAQAFEDEMVAHGQTFSPKLSAQLGEDQLRIAVRRTMAKAEKHGFTKRGPVRLCVELMFLRGSDFDTDPQYPKLGEILRGEGEQMSRADKMFAVESVYQNKVSGEDGANVRKALQTLAAFARGTVPFTSAGLVPELLREMRRAFPEKADHVGEAALAAVIDEGRGAARQYGLAGPRAEALIVVLIFAFGHGCVADPLYPWISQTLTDPRITDAAARADRLERKAITWLDHVLSQPREGRNP